MLTVTLYRILLQIRAYAPGYREQTVCSTIPRYLVAPAWFVVCPHVSQFPYKKTPHMYRGSGSQRASFCTENICVTMSVHTTPFTNPATFTINTAGDRAFEKVTFTHVTSLILLHYFFSIAYIYLYFSSSASPNNASCSPIPPTSLIQPKTAKLARHMSVCRPCT